MGVALSGYGSTDRSTTTRRVCRATTSRTSSTTTARTRSPAPGQNDTHCRHMRWSTKTLNSHFTVGSVRKRRHPTGLFGPLRVNGRSHAAEIVDTSRGLAGLLLPDRSLPAADVERHVTGSQRRAAHRRRSDEAARLGRGEPLPRPDEGRHALPAGLRTLRPRHPLHRDRSPSLPNYLAIAGGYTFGITTNGAPAYNQVVDGLGVRPGPRRGQDRQGLRRGMPSNSATSGGTGYAVRHNPWAYFPKERALWPSSTCPSPPSPATSPPAHSRTRVCDPEPRPRRARRIAGRGRSVVQRLDDPGLRRARLEAGSWSSS